MKQATPKPLVISVLKPAYKPKLPPFFLSDEALLSHYYTTRNFSVFTLLYQRHKESLYRYCAQMSHQYSLQFFTRLWHMLLEKPPKLYGRPLHSWLFIQANKLMQKHSLAQTANAEIKGKLAEAAKIGESKILSVIQQLPRIQRNIFLLHVECRLPLITVADIEKISLKQCREHYRSSKQSIAAGLAGPRRRWRINVRGLSI